MTNRSIIPALALLLISTAFLFSCITYSYSTLDVPGVRKVDKYSGDELLATFYQKHDPKTGAWYEAEKNDAGEWVFTAEGKRDMEMRTRYGSGESTGSGSHGNSQR